MRCGHGHRVAWYGGVVCGSEVWCEGLVCVRRCSNETKPQFPSLAKPVYLNGGITPGAPGRRREKRRRRERRRTTLTQGNIGINTEINTRVEQFSSLFLASYLNRDASAHIQ